MALPFILFAVGAFVCVRTVKASMNYDFGSNRRRTAIRSAVAIGTTVTVLLHWVIISRLAHAALAEQSNYSTGMDLLIRLAAVISGTLIWGYLLPRIAFSVIGKKPAQSAEWGTEPESGEQQTQRSETPNYSWEADQPKKSTNTRVLWGIGICVLAVAVAGIAALIVKNNQTDPAAYAICDAYLKQQMTNAPGATDSTTNANMVVTYIQTKRPEQCPPSEWNPVFTSVARHGNGSIAASFAATTGEANGAATTMPSDGAIHWEYDAGNQAWTTPPKLASKPQAASPTPTQTPTQTAADSPTTDQDFAAQRTRVAPTTDAASQAFTLVDGTGSYGQWQMTVSTATAEQTVHGLVGSQAVKDGKGQQYTCAIYEDGKQIPRVNLAFREEITYRTIENQFGELQGAVNATTTIGGVDVPVEWRTWASRTDRIRLRAGDATRLVRELSERSVDAFKLDLLDNPELSSTYDVSNLLAAIAANGMNCFEN